MGTASWIGGTFCERDGRSAGIGLLRWLDQKPRRECTHLFGGEPFIGWTITVTDPSSALPSSTA